MQKVTYETPALYGDHHVLEVRRILLELPGVSRCLCQQRISSR